MSEGKGFPIYVVIRWDQDDMSAYDALKTRSLDEAREYLRTLAGPPSSIYDEGEDYIRWYSFNEHGDGEPFKHAARIITINAKDLEPAPAPPTVNAEAQLIDLRAIVNILSNPKHKILMLFADDVAADAQERLVETGTLQRTRIGKDILAFSWYPLPKVTNVPPEDATDKAARPAGTWGLLAQDGPMLSDNSPLRLACALSFKGGQASFYVGPYLEWIKQVLGGVYA